MSQPASHWEPFHPGAPPRVRRAVIQFLFVGMGERAPHPAVADRLYLDVGNALRPGVIDHHHLTTGGCTTRRVLDHPGLVAAAVVPGRGPDDPFTIVLHERPDLDCAASAYLAIAYLTTQAFPPGAAALADYVDQVDEGSLGLTQANPFSLYSAYQQLMNKLRPGDEPTAGWRELIEQGIEVTAFAVGQMLRQGQPLPDVDAFACPGLFGPDDRQELQRDLDRYQRKLADPRCQARQLRLRLPLQTGGAGTFEALLVRDVQNADDPAACLFFKDWARSDAARCPGGRGFVALSVFMAEGPRQARRCILSVTPESGASLQGLGALLDQAEAERRQQLHGVDDRVTDPATGIPKPPRAGYDNSDPWYDGRAHRYTIVDAPRSGTRLSAEEIEAIFLGFGRPG